jgi:hypothetical protein
LWYAETRSGKVIARWNVVYGYRCQGDHKSDNQQEELPEEDNDRRPYQGRAKVKAEQSGCPESNKQDFVMTALDACGAVHAAAKWEAHGTWLSETHERIWS